MIYYSEQQGKNNLNGGGDGQEGQKESSGESTPIATKTVSKKSWGIIPEDFTLDAEKKNIPLLLIEVNKVQQILTQIWLQWD